MKPTSTAFFILAVFFRTIAVLSALYGVFGMLAPLLMAGLAMSGLLVRLLSMSLIPAIILWFAAKPLAALIVKGLDDDPKT